MADELGACPCCGAISGTTLAAAPALLTVCDVLVVRALETIGNRLVREQRARRAVWEADGRSLHFAHTLWRPTDDTVYHGLLRAWDVVPAMLDNHGCCGVNAHQVTVMLDSYVRDLLITGTPHSLEELHYRFEAFLGIDLPPVRPYQPQQGPAPTPNPPIPAPAPAAEPYRMPTRAHR